MVDLKQEADQPIDPVTGEIGLHATPIVAGDVIIVGAAHRTGGNPRSRANVKGYVRGYDARTGERLWIFHTIPRPGQFGRETLAGRLGRLHRQHRGVGPDLGGRRARHGLSAGRGVHRRLLRRLPAGATTCSPRAWWRSISTPASGAGTSSSCTTAIWDHDIPCAPILLDLMIDGELVKAVAQPTKQAFLYALQPRERASRSGRSRSGRSRRGTFPASGTRPRSRFRRGRRATTGRASRWTI